MTDFRSTLVNVCKFFFYKLMYEVQITFELMYVLAHVISWCLDQDHRVVLRKELAVFPSFISTVNIKVKSWCRTLHNVTVGGGSLQERKTIWTASNNTTHETKYFKSPKRIRNSMLYNTLKTKKAQNDMNIWKCSLIIKKKSSMLHCYFTVKTCLLDH